MNANGSKVEHLPPAGVFDFSDDDEARAMQAPSTAGAGRAAALAAGTVKPESRGGGPASADGTPIANLALLDARLIHLENPPPKPVPVFKLAGQQISTAGNLTVVAAQAKAGKTATVGAMLAALLLAEREDDREGWMADCLGFEAVASGGRAVIYFDTEQSPYDAWLNLSRAAKRAGMNEIPRNFFAYRLLDLGVEDRRNLLDAEMERRAAECGGIYAVVLDGGADLCLSVNDEAEAINLVNLFIRLAVKHDCPILIIIHENPGDSGKTRGHLGSQLERKAESNLRLVKGKDGVTEIFAERCRNASIPQGRGVCFEWSDEAGMHVRIERVAVNKLDAKKAAAEGEAAEAFRGKVGAVRYAELKGLIAERLSVSAPTAERRIAKWRRLGVIREHGEGYIRK